MVVRAEHILDGRRVKGYTCYRNKEFCLYWYFFYVQQQTVEDGLRAFQGFRYVA